MKRILLYCLLLSQLAVHGQNIPRPMIPAPKGLAVDSYTGNLFYQRDEMSLRGNGYRVYLSFYYNAAADTLDYGYGHGWSFYYNTFYRSSGDTVIIQHYDAKKDTFLLRGGAYKSPAGVYDSLIKASNGSFTLREKDGQVMVFDNASHKKLTRMQDANGNSIVLEYQGALPVKVRNSTGRCLLLSWQDNHLAEAKDSANGGKKFSYTYDAKGDMKEVTNPLNGKKDYEYTTHTISRLSDENGSPVVVEYGSGGKVRKIMSCNSQQEFTFLTSSRQTVLLQQGAAGTISTTFYFDAGGRSIAYSNADGNKTYFSYDNQNNLTEWRSFKGLSTKYAYDVKGNLVKEIDPLGNITQYTYEPTLNNLTSIRDKRGNTTSFTYDGKGNVMTIVKPGNNVQSFTYGSDGRVLTSVNANGNTTTYQYNSDGDPVKVLYPIGSMQFDYGGSCCDVSKITDGNGSTQEMGYDLLGRMISMKDKAGNLISWVYDAAGNIIKETDPNNVTKEYTYDALNRVISVRLKSGTWFYEYDAAGNLAKVTDPIGRISTYQYNGNNQLIVESDGMGNRISYAYDADGNRISRTDPLGNTVAYRYDDRGLLIQKDYGNFSDKFDYDAMGNLTGAYNDNIAYSFQYDNLSRLTRKNIVTWGKSIAYTYDAAGNRKTMTDQDGGVYNYGYDANNRLMSLANPAGLTTSFAYDAGGRITKQTNGNGTFTTYEYDDAGRMNNLTNWQNASTRLSFFNYTFDAYGNRTSMTDKHGQTNYIYDSTSRLTKVTYANGKVETFEFDGAGNRTKRVLNGSTIPYTYNDADQVLTAGITSFTFDANGNTLQQNDTVHRTFQYDGENRLSGVQLAPQKKVQYLYDPFGNRIERIDTLQNITKLVYDGVNLLAELSGNNSTLTKYTSTLEADGWIGLSTGGSNYYYHKDGQNSTTELSGTAGTTQEQYDYDAYGTVQSQSGSVNNSMLYGGKLYESATQLYDNRARFYNSGLGRFINQDTRSGQLRDPRTFNKYGYAANNPVNLFDQDGNGFWSTAVFWTGTTAVTIFFGLEGAAALAVNATAGGLEGAWDAYSEGNGSTECYLYKIGKGGLTGAIPVGKLIRKIPGLSKINPGEFLTDQLRAAGRLGQRSNWDSELKYLSTMFWKSGKAALSSTKFLNQIWGETAGGLEDLSEDELKNLVESNLSKLGQKILDYDPCKKDEDNDKDKKKGPNEPPTGPPANPISVPIEVITPHDPNEITGVAGFDTTHRWVPMLTTLPYKIIFENDPNNATAAAQRVNIYLPIDPKLNPGSLRISDFGFGNFNFTVPPNTSVYTTRLDLRDSIGMFVDVTAGLDITNHRAFWSFQSVDPATGLTTTLPPASGFLPVNDSVSHKGEGYVTFTLQPLTTLHTGDTVAAQGAILFDMEDTVSTNIWVNTIDAAPPVSKMDSLPLTADSSFVLKWNGNDDSHGSGIAYYDLYVSRNHQPFTLYKQHIDSTATSFNGDPGISYSFFTLATDNTGNREPMKYKGDDTVTINLGSTVVKTSCPASITTFTAGAAGADITFQWQVDSGAGFADVTNDSIYSGAGTDTLTITHAPTSYYGYRYRCIVTQNGAITTTDPQLLKFAVIWNGSTDNAWENPANWSCGMLPDENTDVIIHSSAHNPVINVNAICRNLTLDAGATLKLKKGISLETKGR